MSVTITPRIGLYRWSADTDPDNRNQFDTSHAQLEALCAIYGTGLYAALAATTAGRLLRATDAGAVFWDDGAALHSIVGQVLYGDGSDGNVTLATDTTLTQDKYYDTLDLAGHTINAAGFKVFCRTLLKANGGTIDDSGGAGAGGTGGAAAAVGSLGRPVTGNQSGGTPQDSPQPGITGTTGTAAAPGFPPYILTISNAYQNLSTALGGAGGRGGGGNAYPTWVPFPAFAGGPVPRSLTALLNGYVSVTGYDQVTSYLGGGGGGTAGAGDGSNVGGGGGGGGGVVAVYARHVVGTGTISAKGGAGGVGAGGNANGGGGGGGGLVILITNNATHSLTLSAAGGIGGAAHLGGTGAAGASGVAGTVISVLGGS